ncbi:Fe2+-dependent dioxygenase [Glacieibacterium sp.]|uniref:Fe2+-dependent dioxygenase n=1 Tax=Glacieibacterium sp. TaxID=2860237 RepID=UPI003AFF79C7
MMLAIPDVLSAVEVTRVRAIIDAADWVDGNATSGGQSALAKHNVQLPEASAAAREAGDIVLDALGRTPLFVAAALPLRVYPPLFNRYGIGHAFGTHVDNAIRIRRGSDFRIRTDLSATLFLADPDSYDGGELVVEDRPGIKLPAGHMLLYPASTLHRVEPVTRGQRIASFFWVQSMIRSGDDRATLFELDTAIQSLAAERGQGDPDIIRLTNVYHNLLRRSAEL